MKAEIICVGTELLLGDIVNTNARFVAQQLSALGISVYNQQVVGDNPQRLKQAAELAKSRSDIVIYTGGLGPTDDDLTKQTVAAVYNDTLEFNQSVCDGIEAYFNRTGRLMTDNNRKQAYVPQRGRWLQNDYGTAPGIVFIDGEKLAVLMPGVPREMKPMMENQVVPLLKKLVHGAIISRYVRTIGYGESRLEEKISILLQGENPTAALYAKEGEVTVRLTALAEDRAAANAMLDKLYSQLDSMIHDYIYGVDVENIETVLVDKLKAAGKTVATAESCTGGGLSARITSVPGASDVFSLGVCTYSNQQKHKVLGVSEEDLDIYTAVSSPVVAAMAQGIRRKAGSDYAIATTGYRGPGGGTPQEPVGTVYIAVATESRTYVKKCSFAGERARITHLACQSALDLLRCVMDNIPAEGVRIVDNIDYEETEETETKGGKGFVKGFATMIGLILLSAVLAAGYLWYKNSGGQIKLPRINFTGIVDTVTGFFSKEDADVARVIAERQAKDFFRQGFERSTLKTLNSLQAQNHNLEGWISFRYSQKEYAVYNNEKNTTPGNDIHLLSDARIADYTYISGFDGKNFIDLTNLKTVRDNSTFTYFNSGKHTEYQIFSVGTFSRQDLAELTSLTDKGEYIVQIRARSLFDVDMAVMTEDKMLVLLQDLGDEKYVAAFAVPSVRGTFPSVDIKTVAVYSDWYMAENNLSDETFSDALMYAQEVYNRDNWLAAPVIVEQPGTPRPQATPYKSEGKDLTEELLENIDWDLGMEDYEENLKEEEEIIEINLAELEKMDDILSMDEVFTEVWEFDQGTTTPPRENEPRATPPPEIGEGEETLTVTMNGQVVSGPATWILSQIAAIEMTYTWSPEALKAQAVAAHTYLEYQYSRGVTAPAVAGRTSPNQRVIDAVSQVSNLVMTVGGKAVYTPYTASAAGRTNPAGQVWGTHHSHLVSVESKYDYLSTNYEAVKQIPAEKMKEILDARVGTNLDMAHPEEWIKILSYTDGGYVRHMSIGGKTTYPKVNGQPRAITGWYFGSDILADAGYKLRAAAFDVSYADGMFTITTRSYGHGVGMSQWGAQFYATKEGWTYDQILKHYYTGVDIVSWR